MSTVLSFEAEERINFGKGPSRAVRKNSLVPAIIYGAGKEQVYISLPFKELHLQYLKGGFLSHLVKIKVGNKTYQVLPKELQFHPVTDNISHADFIHVNEHQKVKVHVNIELLNREKCAGVKVGGVLTITRHDVELLCYADEIPSVIEVDVADLKINQSIHASDLKLPKNVALAIDGSMTIAAVTGASNSDSDNEDESAAPAASAATDKK